jgi:hypothetical protein
MNRLVICCTGYDQEDKEIMTKFIQDNDGEYSPKILKETCTHLIIGLEDIDSGMYMCLHLQLYVHMFTYMNM